MELSETFSRLGVALGLGLLVGLQRQRTDSRLAGFRTFPLVTLLGSLCGLLAVTLGGWVVATGLVGLALVVMGASLPQARPDDERPGVTTEVAMLVMFLVGAYLMNGQTPVAIAVGGVVAVLLHLKPQMHDLAARIGDRDFTGIMQFALISMVILPVLPNTYFGPFKVLNPFKIWLMVVLIVGISLGGYIVYKFLGARAGAWASGILGGLISSTATTVSLARRSRQTPQAPGFAAFVILVASAIVFLRVSLLIGATTPFFLSAAIAPMLTLFAVLALTGLLNLRGVAAGDGTQTEHENPTELKPALIFGLLYAGVLMAVAFARDLFGQSGLFAVAAISGLTDMDAITLSVTQLVDTGKIPATTGWRVIVVAAISNLVFKAGTVAVLGDRRLFGRIAFGFALAIAAGSALLVFWPG